MKFANFHTTALCSPTRASLLTGRNATTNGMATIAEFASGFPGISTRIPFENGFISEVLAEHGYNTYCVGKWHLTPGEECNLAAFKGRWPLGRGFERFYGWLGGETNSYYPDLVHDNHQIEPPGRPEDGYHVADDLADKAIEFIRDAKVIDPDKPFFMYLAPQAGHAPHLVADGVGRQVQGRVRRGLRGDPRRDPRPPDRAGPAARGHRALADQPARRAGRTGPDGQPWPLLDTVRPWDSLTADEQRLFARMAEVFAGYISYYDHQLGRVLDYLEESGQLDNTIVVVVSDNGASGEGGPNGSFNEWRFFNGVPDTTEATLPHIDELGTPESYNHYNTGWAWALDTPFPYWKRWAGAEGGVADMCLVSWPAQIPASTEPRQQYVHAVDVVPTLYDLLGIEPPEVIKGYLQSPIEGESFAAALTDPDVPGKATQFYTMLGQRSIYHDGLARLDGAPAAERAGATSSRTSGSCSTSRPTARRPRTSWPTTRAGLEALKDLWFYYAGIYNGLPLDDRSASSRCSPSDHGRRQRDRYVFYPNCADVPESAGLAIHGRSYTIAAGVEVDSADVEGVIWAAGGVPGGHSLYVKDGRLHYTFNWVGTTLQDVVADRDITAGATCCTVEFAASGPSSATRRCRARRAPSPSTSTTRPSAPVRSSPSPATSASSATASASVATAPRRSRPTTRRRSPSPAARSTRSSSTSPATATSTTRPRSAPGSRID